MKYYVRCSYYNGITTFLYGCEQQLFIFLSSFYETIFKKRGPPLDRNLTLTLPPLCTVYAPRQPVSSINATRVFPSSPPPHSRSERRGDGRGRRLELAGRAADDRGRHGPGLRRVVRPDRVEDRGQLLRGHCGRRPGPGPAVPDRRLPVGRGPQRPGRVRRLAAGGPRRVPVLVGRPGRPVHRVRGPDGAGPGRRSARAADARLHHPSGRLQRQR